MKKGTAKTSINVSSVVSQVNRRKLTNNTQRVLLALLISKDEWVSRSSIRVPSVGSRLRDLRKPQFGGFKIECVSANKLNRKTNGVIDNHQTFYRLNPSSVTPGRVAKVFEGVISTSNK